MQAIMLIKVKFVLFVKQKPGKEQWCVTHVVRAEEDVEVSLLGC